MVAIVSGNGLGLLGGSAGVLGSGGQTGAAGLGQAGEGAWINAKTGNLLLQRQDELLAGRGPDIGVVRTYNSQGGFDFDNGDSWQLSLYRKLGEKSTHALNTAGSTIKRFEADGSQLTYAFDAAQGKYINRDGAGAYDTLSYDATGNTWTWRDGDSGLTETFETSPTAGEWRIKSVADRDGNALTYGYDTTSGLITSVQTANGETTLLQYNASRQLTRIDIVTAGNVTTTRVRYEYESTAPTARLLKVDTDLTPQDGSVADNNTFVTTYTYHGTTDRVASITHGDGTQLSFTYYPDGKLHTYTDGSGALTTLTYNSGNTTVTDALGQVTTLHYDSNGNLTRLQGPAGSGQDVSYTYNARGDVTQVTDSRGNVAMYGYDSQGNRIREQDAAGNVTERYYNASNQLVRQTVYAVADPDGVAGAQQATQAQSTHYIYDANQRLRFAVSPEGRVAEYRYDGYGQQSASIQHAGVIDLASLASLNYSQDFNAGTAGLSALPAAILRTNNALTITSTQQATDSWPSVTGSAMPLGATWRFEVTTPASFSNSLLQAGVQSGTWNTSAYRRHFVNFTRNGNNEGVVQAQVYEGDATKGGSVTLGTVKANTTYVVELATQPDGSSTLYIYEKGLTPAQGYVNQRKLSGWTQAQFVASTYAGSGAAGGTSAPGSTNTIVLDNLSVTTQAGLSALETWSASQDKSSIERTDYGYDARGLLQEIKRFTRTDSAGAGIVDASTSITQYVRDAAGRLLQSIDARGVASTGVSNDYRTSYVYDGLGRVITLTQYDEAGSAVGSGTTRHTSTSYQDATGKIQLTQADGLIRISQYDARGVLIRSEERNSTQTLLASSTYQYDAAGRLRVLTDAAGGKTYYLYDSAGRQTGFINASGALTEFIYNNAGQVVRTQRYANAVTASLATLFAPNANQVIGNVALSSVRPASNGADQIARTIFDETGRERFRIDERGYVVESRYDGAGRLIQTLAYARALTNVIGLDALGREARPSDIALLDAAPVTGQTGIHRDASNDRVARRLYDGDGLLRAELDAVGYLTEYRYDALDRMTQRIRHAGATDSAYRASGTLAQLLSSTAVVSSASSNLNHYTFHDGQGRVTGEIDDAGYYTTYGYDLAGNRVSQKRHANALVGTAIAGQPPLLTATVPGTTPAGGYVKTGSEDQTLSSGYSAFNQLLWQQAADGTVSRIGYDTAGRVVSSSTGWTLSGSSFVATDVRGQQQRYDLQGRLTGELNALGAVALAALGSTPTQAQIDAVWAAYSTRHEYDAAGRRTRTTDANGNQTLFFYDAMGRITYAVRRVKNPDPAHASEWVGEASKREYNALGQLTRERQMATFISATRLATLTGGAQSQITAGGAPTETTDDRVLDYTYYLTGQIKETKTYLDATTAQTTTVTQHYNAFGQLYALYTPQVSGRTHLQEFYYDRRGLLTWHKQDVPWTNSQGTVGSGPATDNQVRQEWNPFGDLARRIDSRGVIERYAYDKLGRQIAVRTDPDDATGAPELNRLRQIAFDAFDRVIKQTDALGRETLYSYDTANRTVTVTTPEGIVTKTTHNRHGEVIVLVDGLGNETRFGYDKNGNLVSEKRWDKTANVETTVATHGYDTAGLLKLSTTDANGNLVAYTYDAAGRVLTRNVGAGTLNLTTTYQYDAKGQAVTVTDANGNVTQTTFDRSGRVIEVAVDPASLNLRTRYEYDLDGHVLTLTEGYGTPEARRTAYEYDNLGRRIKQVVDPDAAGYTGLKLTTTWTYDGNDNVVARIDGVGTPEVRTTRYTYDALDRLTDTIDALGGVTRNEYDLEGRIVRTTAYAQAINMATFGAPATYTLPLVTALLNQTDPNNRVSRSAYDRDGRLRFVIDALGAVTERQYDAAGNLKVQVRYANALAGTLAANTLPQVVSTPASSGAWVVTSTADRTSSYTYDAFNRLIEKRDGVGAKDPNNAAVSIETVESWAYDKVGNVIRHTDVRGQREWFAHDAANRQIRRIDAGGYVTDTTWRADGQKQSETRYLKAVTLSVSDDAWAYTGHSANPIATTDPLSGDRTTGYDYDGAGRLLTLTDALGNITHYGYDAVGNLLETTEAFGTSSASVTSRSYDSAGRIVTETIAHGTADASTATYAHDAHGNQTGIMVAVGTSAVRTTLQTFDLVGRKISVADGVGAITRTTHNVFGDIVKVTDALNNVGYFYNDALGRVTLQIDPAGAVIRTTYDLHGNAVDVVKFANRVQGTPNENSVVQILQAAGTGVYVVADAGADQHQSTIVDARGRASQIKTWFGANAVDFYTEAFTYDAGDNVLSHTARNGATTSYTYNALGQKSSETLPVTTRTSGGAVISVQNSFAYDAFGNITVRAEAVGAMEQRETAYSYDKANRRLTETGQQLGVFDAVSGTTSMVTPVKRSFYDRLGNLIEEVDARGARTLHYYDHASREVGRIDGSGAYTAWAYDAAGNRISETRYANAVEVIGPGAIPNQLESGGAIPLVVSSMPVAGTYVLRDTANDRTTFFSFDSMGRLTGSRIDGMMIGAYDPSALSGQGQYQINFDSLLSQTVYDASGNVSQIIDANGKVTRRYYDAAGQLAGQLDALNYLTIWTRDAYGNVAQETRYANALTLAVSNGTTLATLTSAVTESTSDRTTIYVYDKLNRVLAQTVTNVSSGSVNASNGVLTEVVTNATTSYVYDGLGNVTTKIDATGALGNWTYDGLGRKLQEQRPAYADYQGTMVRPTTDWEYDGLNQIKRELERGTNNNVETDDRITTYTYGTGGFLASQTDPAGAQLVYGVDANGNITRKTLLGRLNVDGASTNDVTTYIYDALNRQIRSTDVGTGTTQEVRYNTFGEISGKRINGGGTDVTWQESADYDRAGRAWRSNFGDGITRVYVFDANGNATLTLGNPSANLAGQTLASTLALGSNSQTVSVFDARNQLIDTIQPSMTGGHTQIAIQQTLAEQGGTSFAGVGGSTLGVAAGQSVAGAVTMPAIVGGVTVSRSQALNVTDNATYVWGGDYYTRTLSSATHSLTLNLPDTSAWGSGNVRIHFDIDPGFVNTTMNGVTTTYQVSTGAHKDVWTAPTSGSVTVSFTEGGLASASSLGTSAAVNRAYSYSLYKQTATGDVLLGSYTGMASGPTGISMGSGSTVGTTSTSSSTTVVPKLIQFSGQSASTTRLVLLSRPVGANSGWTVTNVPQYLVNGVAVAGGFALDWSSWAAGSYEFRYMGLDASGSVINSEQGTLVLSNTAPSATQVAHSIGGAGRAFMDSAGKVHFTEQGNGATQLEVKYRAENSSNAWTTVNLTPYMIGGAAINGWFVLETAGLSGGYEYQITARNAAGATINKGGGTFAVGNANSVVDPSGTTIQTNPTVGVSAVSAGVLAVSGSVSRTFTDTSYMAGKHVVQSLNDRFTLSVPDTSAWGTGNVRIAVNVAGSTSSGSFSSTNYSTTYGGGSSNTYVSSGAQLVTIDISESVTSTYNSTLRLYFGATDANYSYALYKQTANGEIYLGGYAGNTASAGAYTSTGSSTSGSSRVTSKTVASNSVITGNRTLFTVSPASATRLMLQYRVAGSGSGWSTTSVPAGSLPGQFVLDWSSWALATYEIRQSALDAAGNVLNTGAGTMVLSSGAPSISLSNDLIGGAGRAFMGTNISGVLNFTEQGASATTATIRYRTAGSAGLWSTRQTLLPATRGGVLTPGWFQFDAASFGLAGNIEYVLEARNASGQIINKVAGSFTTGVANSVSALTGYLEPPVVMHFTTQPASATRLQLGYRPVGSNGAFTHIDLARVGSGAFDWDTSSVFASDTSSAGYEYQYTSYDGNGVVVNKAHGTVTLGAAPALISHINDPIPTLLSLQPPTGNPVAATATQLLLQYRLTGSGSYSTTTLTRTDTAQAFVWDASALIPPGGTGSIDYSYTLKNAGNTLLLDASGAAITVAGTLQVGASASDPELVYVATGSTTLNSVIHRRQSHDAFGQVIQETDGLGNVTDLSYNALGRLVQKQDPTTTATLANGFQQTLRPTTRYIYDLAGHLVAMQDPNGNYSKQTLLPGDGEDDQPLVLAEFHADGGIKRSGYDIFGDLRYGIDEIGRRTDYSYDKASRLVRLDRPSRATATYDAAGNRTDLHAWDQYAYDAAGNRISHRTRADGAASSASDYVDKTWYDSLGRVTRSTTALGRSTTYTYAWDATVVGLASQRTGGWIKTATDPLGRTLVDRMDQFGRVTQHIDRGAHVFSYSYNNAGWLTNQSNSAGQNVVTDYYANGYVKRITDVALGTVSDYEYDANGNRTYEAYSRTVGGVTENLQNASVTYDALNRVQEIKDLRADIRYEYDANGNRRRVWSYYHDGIGGSMQTQDNWYLYDSMNRFTLSMGKLGSADGHRGTSESDATVAIVLGNAAGSAVVNPDGVQLFYDLAGQRKRIISARDGHREDYSYTVEGYLANTWLNSSGSASQGPLAAARTNDTLGRVTAYTEYTGTGAIEFTRTTTYDADSRSLTQVETTVSSNTTASTTFRYYTSVAGENSVTSATAYTDTSVLATNGAGELANLRTSTSVNGAAPTVTNSWTRYTYWDDAKQLYQTISASNSSLGANNSLWKKGISAYSYNVNGHLSSAVDAGADGSVGTADDVSFSYLDNAQGLTLRRDQMKGGGLDKQHRYLYLNGQTVGDIGNDGDTRLDYAQSLAQAPTDRATQYRNWQPIASADFDQNYQPINASYPSATASSYTVRAGESLYQIAASVWGDASLWYLLADANGLNAGVALTAGQVLTIPNKVTNLHNNSSTFRPYNAGEIIGDTSPTLPDAPPPPPPPRKKKKCGGLGGIIVAVVTVAVAVATSNYQLIPAALKGSAVASAAFAAGMGNIAGQIVGNAIGVQSGFNFSGLATDVLSAGITRGLLGNTPLGAVVGESAAATAALNNVVRQGVANVTGQQRGFSWASVAASAISAPIASSINNSLFGDVAKDGLRYGGSLGIVDQTAKILAESMTSALVSATTRVAIVGGRLQWEAVAADALSSFVSSRISRDGAIELSNIVDGALKQASANVDINKGISAYADDAEKMRAYTKALEQGKTEKDAAITANLVDIKREVDSLTERIAANTDDPSRPDLIKTRTVLIDALASKDVYFGQSISEILPNGVSRMNDAALAAKELSYTNTDLQNKEGFFGALYENTNTSSGRATYIFANRGTESGGAGFRDWITNFLQAFGYKDAQFAKAVDVGRVLYDQLGGNMTFTGHSLGGGLAAAQAMAVQNGRAITFNAEGLSDGTIRRYGLNTQGIDQRIAAFYVNGEVLARLQDSPISSAITLAYGTVPKNLLGLAGMVGDVLSGTVPDTSRLGLPVVASAQGRRVEMPAVNLSGQSLDVLDRFTNTVSLHFMDYALQSLHTQMQPNGTLPANYLRNIR